jgi:hypothetical protein
METIIGFVAGYLVGTRQGREGLDKARKAVDAIRTSPEVRRLAATGMTMAEAVVRQAASNDRKGRHGLAAVVSGVTEIVMRRAAGTDDEHEGTQAA